MYHIFHDIEIKASSKEIFDMITIPDMLNKWWTNKSTGKAREFEEYNFYFSDEYNWFAKVSSIKLNNSVVFKMIDADEDWINTELSFEILDKSETTKLLRFEHKNWKSINEHFRRTSYCWAQYFEKMKNILEVKTKIMN